MTRYDVKWMYEEGEPCWVQCGEQKDGKYVTSSGRVVANFTHRNHLETFFIIKLDNPNAPYFVVRDALQMSPSPDVEPTMRTYPTLDGGRWPYEVIGMPHNMKLTHAPVVERLTHNEAAAPDEIEAEIDLDDDDDDDD